MFYLSNFARSFAMADNADEVGKALEAVADPAGLKLFAVGRLAAPRSRVELARAVGLYSGIRPDVQADWQSEYFRRGPALTTRHAATVVRPFRMVEAMRVLQPSGGDRWLFDLLRDHGIKDALWTVHNAWTAVYLSDRVLNRAALSDEARLALSASGAMAIDRLVELAAGEDAQASVSPREKTVLLHLSGGLKVLEIAARLGIAEPSVKTLIRRAARKLGAKSQLHAVALAVRQRLI